MYLKRSSKALQGLVDFQQGAKSEKARMCSGIPLAIAITMKTPYAFVISAVPRFYNVQRVPAAAIAEASLISDGEIITRSVTAIFRALTSENFAGEELQPPPVCLFLLPVENVLKDILMVAFPIIFPRRYIIGYHLPGCGLSSVPACTRLYGVHPSRQLKLRHRSVYPARISPTE